MYLGLLVSMVRQLIWMGSERSRDTSFFRLPLNIDLCGQVRRSRSGCRLSRASRHCYIRSTWVEAFGQEVWIQKTSPLKRVAWPEISLFSFGHANNVPGITMVL